VKRYGFKFQKSLAEKSKINRNVGTWIGLVGTALFLVSATISGGFKGPMIDGLFLTIAYPAFLWFLSLLGIQREWPIILIIILSIFFSRCFCSLVSLPVLFKRLFQYYFLYDDNI